MGSAQTTASLPSDSLHSPPAKNPGTSGPSVHGTTFPHAGVKRPQQNVAGDGQPVPPSKKTRTDVSTEVGRHAVGVTANDQTRTPPSASDLKRDPIDSPPSANNSGCTTTQSESKKSDRDEVNARSALSTESSADNLSRESSQGKTSSARGTADEAKARLRLYTRTGDGGTSSLFNGQRASKGADYFGALGDLDELNAVLGLVREHCLAARNGLADLLGREQGRLLELGAHVATPLSTSKPAQVARTCFDGQSAAKQIEKEIDALDAKLPPLTTFVLPSGGLAATHLHVARTICRRAERHLTPLVEREDANRSTIAYLNRLSDLLFAAARTAAAHEKRPELTWHSTSQK